ncbi:MAG: peptidylprolyl isomerase [Gammaproteobacteria bacterium]|jgi:peptidyl-prolyl cis-trans isomerase B (cyclophilin B)|nr:peptidylprolyl isomerase [Gammaproteobacteria bacterium]
MSKIQITVLAVIIITSSFTLYYPQEDKMSLVTISTSTGDIHLELDDVNAPITVQNFLKLAKDNYYAGTIFHRIIEGFMIQGGGLDESMTPKPTSTEPIQNEANNGLKNNRGTVAMARTMDPHSATGQFFINHKDNSFLNHTSETSEGWGYAVFGSVIDGMDVVDQIALSTTSTVGGYADAPLEPTIINSITVSE